MFRVCVGILVSIPLLACISGLTAASELADPTRPDFGDAPVTASKPVKPGLPRLQSVLIGPDRRLAVIGGRLLAEGESADGMRLLQVRPDRVRVELKERGAVTLRLNNRNIRKESR